ncbi:MAG: hypothetical protein M3Y13_13725 [Armatimonadota bacterium]|nr:hypothetical protein [Armatimonadota bacterium]
MARYNASILLPVLLGVAGFAAGPALAAPGETLLYGGQALGQGGIMVTPWGGGTVLDSTNFSLFSGANDHAFQITTLGHYQGAKINYDPPAALGEAADGKTRVLQISIRPVKLAADPSTLTRFNRFGGGGFGGGNADPIGQDGGQDNGYPGSSSPGGEMPGMSSPGGGEEPGMSSPGGE